MSSISSAATQQKFTALRKRLDQLGYRQPLGIESLPLVERLFADLVHTTDRWVKKKKKTWGVCRTCGYCPWYSYLVVIYFNYICLHSFVVFLNFSLKTAKLQSVKSPGDKGNLDAAIEPYRSDNAKLVKENNELHQQLIKAKEDLEVSSKGNCHVALLCNNLAWLYARLDSTIDLENRPPPTTQIDSRLCHIEANFLAKCCCNSVFFSMLFQ